MPKIDTLLDLKRLSENNSHFLFDYLTSTDLQRSLLDTSLYDTVFCLGLNILTAEQEKAVIQRVLKLQNKNTGLWDEQAYLPHSTVTNTLAVLIAFKRNNITIPRLEKLKASLNQKLGLCKESKSHNTIAFEFIAPKFINKLEKMGLSLELSTKVKNYLKKLNETSDRKLLCVSKVFGNKSLSESIKLAFLNPESPLTYSAELLSFIEEAKIDKQDQASIYNSILANGAVGLSPAASAEIIRILKENNMPVPHELYTYLQQVFQLYKEEGLPSLDPVRQTNLLWNLLYVIATGEFSEMSRNLKFLHNIKRYYKNICIRSKGVSWDPLTPLLDLDDTALTISLYCELIKAGLKNLQPITPKILKYFYTEKRGFVCYQQELHASIGALMHALMAFDKYEETFGVINNDKFVIKKYRKVLLNQLNPSNFNNNFDLMTRDKWHLSWTYGFCKWLCTDSILKTYPNTIYELIIEACKRQFPNGGFADNPDSRPSIEETSYVIIGLWTILKKENQGKIQLSKEIEIKIQAALKTANDFIKIAFEEKAPYSPSLWISKSLYKPSWSNGAVVLALYLAKKCESKKESF